MTAQGTIPSVSFVGSELAQQRVRQAALLVAMLISGGLLIFPRLPLLVVMLALCFVVTNPMSVLRGEFKRIWLLFGVVAAAALAAGGFEADVLAIRYANFIGGLVLLAMYVDRERSSLARDLVPIFRIFAIQAVLTVLLARFGRDLFTSVQIEEAPYFTIGYIFTFHDFLELGTGWMRPDGFFYEPGVLQMYCSIYLFIALFMMQRAWWDIGLALLALQLTQSTTGVVIAVVLLGGVYLRYLRTGQANQTLAILLIVPLLIAPIFLIAQGNVYEKFFGVARGSSWARQYDLMTGIAVIKQHPWIGIGFDYDAYYRLAGRIGYLESQLSLENLTNRANSNGLLTLFYTVGIPIGLWFLWSLYRQRFFPYPLFFFGLMVLSLGAEALIYTPFVLMILFSGLLPRRRAAETFVVQPAVPRLPAPAAYRPA